LDGEWAGGFMSNAKTVDDINYRELIDTLLKRVPDSFKTWDHRKVVAFKKCVSDANNIQDTRLNRFRLSSAYLKLSAFYDC
jgi:hypothetical protein